MVVHGFRHASSSRSTDAVMGAKIAKVRASQKKLAAHERLSTCNPIAKDRIVLVGIFVVHVVSQSWRPPLITTRINPRSHSHGAFQGLAGRSIPASRLRDTPDLPLVGAGLSRLPAMGL